VNPVAAPGSGLYSLPGNVNVSAFYNARQGYPFEPFILVSRGSGAGGANVLLGSVGANRRELSEHRLHVRRPVTFGRTPLRAVRWICST
jgi:hypothetical protein